MIHSKKVLDLIWFYVDYETSDLLKHRNLEWNTNFAAVEWKLFHSRFFVWSGYNLTVSDSVWFKWPKKTLPNFLWIKITFMDFMPNYGFTVMWWSWTPSELVLSLSWLLCPPLSSDKFPKDLITPNAFTDNYVSP